MQLLANTTSPYVRIARVAMIEKGLHVEPTLIDPWADDIRLRNANAATRVPTLITDDGTPLTESLLIVQWPEHTRLAPAFPSLLGMDAANVLSRRRCRVSACAKGVPNTRNSLPSPPAVSLKFE
jgi:glutathione S-transferase